MLENYKVYVHIFPNNKTYVGITRQNVKDRWQQGLGYKNQPVFKYIQEFGWDNIEHLVLYDNISREEAQEKEIELIKKYDSIQNGYNVSSGGSTGGESWCEYEYNGIIVSAKELAEMSEYDLSYHDITNRINCRKWDIDRAINTPKEKKK